MLPLLLSLAALLVPVLVTAQTCNATSSCPATAPCCSEYGFCGTGSYCLGGCEPLFSFSAGSCKPNPICQNLNSTFYNLERVQTNASLYNGNATAHDWVVNSGTVIPTDVGTKLVLTETNGGTKISSTRYVHYGTISFVLQTARWPGVVTAAITMSDVKDEIDWEFTGSDTTHAQTNYWFLGVANYSNTEGATYSVNSDTSSNFHTYTLDWQAEYINWSIDGNVVRTVQKSDTYDSAGVAHYPSTPSRIQISIWPAGISTSAPGTVQWAGGMIDWSDPDYIQNGYFWNTIQSVSVICADDVPQVNATTGWAYTGNQSNGLPEILDTNASTIIGSARRVVDLPTRALVSVVLGLLPVLLFCAYLL